jgi:hypothetical protein
MYGKRAMLFDQDYSSVVWWTDLAAFRAAVCGASVGGTLLQARALAADNGRFYTRVF